MDNLTPSLPFDTCTEQASSDGVPRDIHQGSDLSVCMSCEMEFNDPGYIKPLARSGSWRRWGCSLGRMTFAVLGLSHQFQIRDLVVQRVSIDVMDDLPPLQGPPKMLRHHNAMFSSEHPFVADVSIPVALVDVTALPSRVGGTRQMPHRAMLTAA